MILSFVLNEIIALIVIKLNNKNIINFIKSKIVDRDKKYFILLFHISLLNK